MDKIIEVEGQELQMLLKELVARELRGHWHNKPYKLRVCIEGNGVKFKINESTWSPALGHLDPTCLEAERNA